jgi:putative membrane protein
MIRRPIFSILTVFAGAALFVGTSALSQMNPGQTAPQTPANPSANPNANPNGMSTADTIQQQQTAASGQMQDKAFVRKAMEGGMAEVQLGQLASEKASSDDVKQFGQKMVDDHTKLNEQMQPVAQQLGVNPPKQLSKKDQETKAKLQSLSGTEFDNEYIKLMLKDHKKDAAEFKEEAQRTQNPAVQQAAQQGSQVIDQHLQLIEQIAQSHNVTNAKGKTSGTGR